MAGISTSIELQDRMSGALNRITASLYATMGAFEGVDAASDQAFNSATIQAAAQELYSYDQRVTQLEADLVDANNRIQQMQEETEKASRAADGLRNVFRSIMGIVGMIGVSKIVNQSDELVQTVSRLNMMNDGAQTTQELFNMVYDAAQDARGSFSGMTDAVARFGNNARDAFSSSAEVVAFANIVQKQMTVAGASTAGAEGAMLQLSQALGSGVLRGDELNSIFEQAPNLIQSIADYMDVPIGRIRDMASEGQLTADIVKAAVFASADEVNARFEEMPKTWAQIWQSMQNTALMKFQPVLQRINDIANSEGIQTLVDNVTSGMVILVDVALDVFDTVGAIATFISDNWSVIAPIVLGVAAAFAVYEAWMLASAAATALAAAKTAVLDAVMGASPIMLAVMAIILLTAALYALCSGIAETTDSVQSGFGIIAGAVMTVVAFIWNVIYGLFSFLVGIGVELRNLIATFANFLENVFNDPIAAIVNLFVGVFDVILGVVESAAGLLDSLLGTDMSGAVEGFRNKIADATAEIIGEQDVVMEKVSREEVLAELPFERLDYETAFNIGASWGDGISEDISGMFDMSSLLGDTSTDAYGNSYEDAIAGLLGDIETNTAATTDSVDISNENLKYMRDAAEAETINRFTTAEIKVDMTNHNSIASDMDIDGIVTQLSDGLREAMEATAEGVHE